MFKTFQQQLVSTKRDVAGSVLLGNQFRVIFSSSVQ